MATLLTNQQVADRLGVTTMTIYRWRKGGSFIPTLQIGERRIMFRQSDLETWLVGRTIH